ncbi:Crp/Fnr family transcriptional regulator [Crocinitomix algicola]|uniref:Crp/Fnr family transcriptional regulator n=1 Tax=Crocinitomix algicola TaxID=1740263 RepID=UPI000871BD40|nr:Crp/Fnr family transcriptional regulator [Crocinitomix algicola]
MKSILKKLITNGILSPHEISSIQIKETKINKGTILQRAGEPGGRAFYVKEGLVRAYTIDEKGKEHIFMFASEGWMVSDFEWRENAPALLFVDCIEDSLLEIIEQNDIIKLNRLFETKQVPNQINQLMNRIRVLQKRIILLMSADTLTRYEDFIETYPDIVQRVPQRMIASYLGVTPEALSKIKSKMLKKH